MSTLLTLTHAAEHVPEFPWTHPSSPDGPSEPACFRLIQFSVQRDHLHLIVEASGLSRGVRGLSIRVARATTNGELGRKGRVFADRYSQDFITVSTIPYRH